MHNNKHDDDIEIIGVVENKNLDEEVDQYKDLIDDLLDERNDFELIFD